VPGARPHRPPLLLGAGVGALAVGLTTLLIYPLADVAPVTSLGVVYLVSVLLVSSVWGGGLGVATAFASAAAFNWFHIPPTGRFTIRDGEHLVALVIFLITAIVVSQLAERGRQRAQEAQERRREADLAAEMARLLLRGERLGDALPLVASRLAQTLELPSAALELRAVDGDERRAALPLHEGPRQIGTLLVPATLPEPVLGRLQLRVVPSLEALLAAGREREALLNDVVETAALRRSDVLKTALLRSVSHDLRSPLTAILTAVEAVASPGISADEHGELTADMRTEALRLSRLIDNLLDLSRLEAGAADPRVEWCAVDEIVYAAIENLGLPEGTFTLSVDASLPPIRADAAQLERAFANLLENGARHGAGHPVSVRIRDVGRRILMRVVDRGPGIGHAQAERIFEPFFRAGTDGHPGSGLGLAIARGFIEANGGRVWVESLPGQATAFVVELPLEAVPAERVAT
jgi:two-component system sensor histidine kinase KdpD